MAQRIVLAKSFDPQGGPAEDWWFLVVDDGGEMHVDHEWVRHNPLKRSGRELKTRRYSIAELLATTRHEPRGPLRHVLRQRGIIAGPSLPQVEIKRSRRRVNRNAT